MDGVPSEASAAVQQSISPLASSTFTSAVVPLPTTPMLMFPPPGLIVSMSSDLPALTPTSFAPGDIHASAKGTVPGAAAVLSQSAFSQPPRPQPIPTSVSQPEQPAPKSAELSPTLATSAEHAAGFLTDPPESVL